MRDAQSVGVVIDAEFIRKTHLGERVTQSDTG